MNRCRIARATFASLVGLAAAGVTGCGGASPTTQAPAVATAPAPPIARTPAPDLSPVAPPQALVASGVLSKPSGSLARVRSWANIPIPQSEQATELLLGEASGALVDLEQPVHFAVALGPAKTKDGPLGGLDGGFLVAVSAAVQNIDAAKAALSDRYKLVPSQNGALFIQGMARPQKPEADGDEDEDEAPDMHRSCELAPAYGPAPYRLVCAFGNEKALAELGPWLTRGATRTRADSDLHVDIQMQPLQEIVAGQGKMFGDLVGGLLASSLPLPSLRELVTSGLHDVVDFGLDMQTETFDVTLSDSAARSTMTVSLPRTTSTMARMMAFGAERNGPPPDAFWQLPGDATVAAFGRGADDTILAHARGLVLKIVDEELTQDGVPPADRKAVVAALDKLAVSSPGVVAAGLDPEAAGKVAAALAAPADPADPGAASATAWAAASQLVGWEAGAIDRPGVELSAQIQALVAAWNRPGVVGTYRAKLKGVPLPVLRSVPMPRGKAWPAGSAQILVEIAPPKTIAAPKGGKARAALKPVTFHALVVPDGARTLFAVAGDEALAASKIAALTTPAGDTLAARPELAALKAARVGSAGFFTMRGLFAEIAALAAMLGAPPREVAAPLEELGHLPQKGMTPWVFTTTSTSSTPPSTVGLTFELPRGAIDDLAAMAVRMGF
jgi:hypothetical protein